MPSQSLQVASRYPQPTLQFFDESSPGQHYSVIPPRDKNAGSRQLVTALGWFSVGLGLVQLLAPRRMSRAIGVADYPAMMRMIGVRELVIGAGILTQPKQGPWLRARVAGDIKDLAMLGIAASTPRNRRSRVLTAASMVAGIAALDLIASARQSDAEKQGQYKTDSGAVVVEKVITVNRPAEECYRFWRDFDNFPRFMTHVESVEAISDTRSHWKVKAPMGASVEWDAEITDDQPNRLLSWHSVQGAEVDNAGTVYFEPAPGERGTTVRVKLQYSPPAGKLGAAFAKLFGEEPAQQIDSDLRHFKQLIETGVIPTTVGQSAGTRSFKTRVLFRKGAPG